MVPGFRGGREARVRAYRRLVMYFSVRLATLSLSRMVRVASIKSTASGQKTGTACAIKPMVDHAYLSSMSSNMLNQTRVW